MKKKSHLGTCIENRQRMLPIPKEHLLMWDQLIVIDLGELHLVLPPTAIQLCALNQSEFLGQSKKLPSTASKLLMINLVRVSKHLALTRAQIPNTMDS